MMWGCDVLWECLSLTSNLRPDSPLPDQLMGTLKWEMTVAAFGPCSGVTAGTMTGQ